MDKKEMVDKLFAVGHEAANTDDAVLHDAAVVVCALCHAAVLDDISGDSFYLRKLREAVIEFVKENKEVERAVTAARS